MKKKNRDIEKEYPRKQFIAKLRRLADALEAGNPFRIQIANERLFIPKNVFVNIEHEREKGTQELEFQMKWQNKHHARKNKE